MASGPIAFLLLPWVSFAFADTGKPCQDAVCQAEEEDTAALLQAMAAKVGKSSDQTDITTELNGLLNDGVVVRTPDFITSAGPKPATLWRNDIFPPNQFYMLDDNGALRSDQAHVGYAMDNSQWNNLVLNSYYPHDANACDPPQNNEITYGRCTWSGKNWECPGAWVADDLVSYEKDVNAIGASAHQCRGCHFDQKTARGGPPYEWQVNQDFGLVDLSTGQCNCPPPSVLNYDREGVCKWVQQNLVDTKKMFNPSWSLDPLTCWVDNPVALSHFQNCYYWKYYNGNYGNAEKEWWGWNEIGMDGKIDDPQSWRSILIFLPSQLNGKGLGQLGGGQQDVVDQLLALNKNGKLKVGRDHIASRPGSYVVMANEFPDQNSNWKHYFFCQSWKYGELQVCFKAKEDDHPNNRGYCYLEWSNNPCA